IVTALTDIRLRYASPAPCVSPARIGSNESGSTPTSSTTKNFINSSNMGEGDNSPLALAARQGYNRNCKDGLTGRKHTARSSTQRGLGDGEPRTSHRRMVSTARW